MDAERTHAPREAVVQVYGQAVVVREIVPTQAPVVFGFLERVTAGLAGVTDMASLSRLLLDDAAMQQWIVEECTDAPWPMASLGVVSAMKILRAWFEVNVDFFDEALVWMEMVKNLLGRQNPGQDAMPKMQAA